RAWPFLQRRQPLCDQARTRAGDRSPVDSGSGRQGAVRRLRGGCEQETGAGHWAGRGRSTRQQGCTVRAFLVSQRDKRFFLGSAGQPPGERLTSLSPMLRLSIKFSVMEY